ncbi:hypothetical protein B4109_3009 [Geobacillus stearothermophilus]|uniref:Uncharacterized protein n=1 Tax=Geobacillus stearothermophilus TaxID=1422 RepID=A0A150MVT2_GEOSE|nr:hypothetical protein B4109_3009 [Geobacillus stearothermophilus]
MKKWYVIVQEKKSADGERLIRIKTTESRPKKFTYVVFAEK